MGTVLDPRLSGFNTALSTSVNYNGNTYQTYGANILQSKIDNEFLFATDVFLIQEEQTFGQLDWSSNFTVRICHVLGDKNTGEGKLNDDFRNVIFQNVNYAYALGKRYSFNSNYWITTNTDTYKFPTASAVIRRCNNVLNNYDSNGVLHTEPCIIDSQIRRPDFDFNSNIIIPFGHTTIILQGNDWTKEICKINQRFMFGGQSWKCTFVNNFQRINTLDSTSVNIIRMILMKDNISPDDDIVNNIPNISSYLYTIAINQGNTLTQSVGFMETLSATVKLNNEIVTVPLTWTSSNPLICTVDNSGNIHLLAIGSCTITCAMTDNLLKFSNMVITVSAIVPVVKTNVISPTQTDILQTAEVTYTVGSYTNGVLNADTFTVVASGVTVNTYYTLTILSGNSFKIKNILKYTTNKLHVVCTNAVDSTSVSIDINLKGVY